MVDYNLAPDLPEYDFTEWENNQLRATGKALFDFLKIHVPAQTAPEEILLDADQALVNIAFELSMRRLEIPVEPQTDGQTMTQTEVL